MELAWELARSGDYSGWWTIEAVLRNRGYSRAKSLLDNERTRERLDRSTPNSESPPKCLEAPKASAAPPT